MRGSVAHAVGTRSGPRRTFPGGRVCGDCGEALSIYNPGPNCWKHTGGNPWRGPTAKPKF
ncbi:MAG: hypothetical protein WDA71_00285 [Actinomycetota bacterium]|jgi:hypothetical protein